MKSRIAALIFCTAFSFSVEKSGGNTHGPGSLFQQRCSMLLLYYKILCLRFRYKDGVVS